MRKPASWITRIPLLAMMALVVAAIATPPAAAANMLPDARAGALALIVAVAALLFALVFEVWRQTAQNSLPLIERQIAERRSGRRVTITR